MKHLFFIVLAFKLLGLNQASAFNNVLMMKKTVAVDTDCITGTPSVGTVCTGGAIYMGNIGADKYMTTPGGCTDIPAGSIAGGTGASAYATSDFTPVSCTGTDALTKYWNDGSANYYDVPGITNYTATTGIGNGAINTDANLGSVNSTAIVAISAGPQGGFHAAARYCDKLAYGTYTDWYLPNRYELNLFVANKASLPGVHTTYYTSSSEYDSDTAWAHRTSDDTQSNRTKSTANRIRCVRRY